MHAHDRSEYPDERAPWTSIDLYPETKIDGMIVALEQEIKEPGAALEDLVCSEYQDPETYHCSAGYNPGWKDWLSRVTDRKTTLCRITGRHAQAACSDGACVLRPGACWWMPARRQRAEAGQGE